MAYARKNVLLHGEYSSHNQWDVHGRLVSQTKVGDFVETKRQGRGVKGPGDSPKNQTGTSGEGV